MPAVPRYSDADAANFDAAWQLEDALLGRLRDEIDQDGAVFAVLMIPDGLQIQPEWLQADYPLFYPAMLDYMNLEQPDQELLSIRERKDIPYLRLYQLFRERWAETGEELYGSHEHLTEAGHRLVAEALYEWLLSEDILPQAGR